MLKILDRDGHLPSYYPYPLQVWQFGSDLSVVALCGDCAVDYTLRLKRTLGRQQLWKEWITLRFGGAMIPIIELPRFLEQSIGTRVIRQHAARRR